MKKVAVDYKGKYFTIQDRDIEDPYGMDFVVEYVDVRHVLTKGLEEHVANCLYYGIPPYIGRDKKLLSKISKIVSRITYEDTEED